jgi:hypothetical protein
MIQGVFRLRHLLHHQYWCRLVLHHQMTQGFSHLLHSNQMIRGLFRLLFRLLFHQVYNQMIRGLFRLLFRLLFRQVYSRMIRGLFLQRR